MQSAKKTIHYKCAVITGDGNLQTLLATALAPAGVAAKPRARQQFVNSEEKSVIFINRLESYSGMLFGQLIHLEAGKRQPYITVIDDAEFYSIDAMASDQIPDSQQLDKTKSGKKKDGDDVALKRREFVDSILYFGVFNNHVVLLQSSSLKSRELEAHLSWVLKDLTSTMPSSNALMLIDKPAESVIRRMEAAPVKSVKIGSPVTSIQVDETTISQSSSPSIADHEEPSGFASKVKFVPTGTAASLLRAVLPEMLSTLQLDEALDDANLHVSLEVTYNRKTSKVGQKVIDQLATSLRHIPESDVAICLQGGGKIKGNELKLSSGIKVQYTAVGLIDESVLFHEMHKWLVTSIGNQEIDATGP